MVVDPAAEEPAPAAAAPALAGTVVPVGPEAAVPSMPPPPPPLSSSSSAHPPPPPPPQSAADASRDGCALSVRLDLSAARRMVAAPEKMVELLPPRQPCPRGAPLLSEPWSTDAVVGLLTPPERQRLRALQLACPAFFAPRGATTRDRARDPHVDWIHKKRRIRDSAVTPHCTVCRE